MKTCDMHHSIYLFVLIFVAACVTLLVLVQMPNISTLNSKLSSLASRKKWFANLSDTALFRSNKKSRSSINSVTDESFYPKPMEIRPPAVLLRPKGGIGNQLFFYACHYALARKHDWPLYIMVDSRAYPNIKNRQWTVGERDFSLDQFNIPLYGWNTANESWVIHDAVGITDSMLLSGNYPLDKVVQLNADEYCQGAAFFTGYEDEIRTLFEQKGRIPEEGKLKEWLDLIEATEDSVAVHIRRGDALAVNDSAPLSFHKDCMERLVERISQRGESKKPPVFLVFSDTIEFVRENLILPSNSSYNIHFVSNPAKLSSLEEFYLMRKCKHFINSPSSFSWWAAFLSKSNDNGKLVYAGHHRKSAIANMYGGPKVGRYYVWLYNHIYYPSNWNSIDPWNETLLEN